jgi:hypothetical protein
MKLPFPPLTFIDVNMLLAIATIFVLIVTELSSTRYGQITLIVDRKKLQTITWIIIILFLAVSIIRVVSMVSS